MTTDTRWRTFGKDSLHAFAKHRTNATVGGSLLGSFVFQLLGVARASDSPVPCGDRPIVVGLFNILDVNTKRDGYLGCTRKKPPNVFSSLRYRVTRSREYDSVIV